MSDTATAELPASLVEKVENIEATTKKGFDITARLKGRGLRRASIVVYLDEELGAEIGDARDVFDGFNNVIGRERTGVIGQIDEAQEKLRELEAELKQAKTVEAVFRAEVEQQVEGDVAVVSSEDVRTIESLIDMAEGAIPSLEAKRDELIEKLTKSGLTIQMQAVPPIIQKDTRRLARQSLDIQEKGIPEDKQEEFNIAAMGHLMAAMFQSVTDNATGDTNPETSFADALALMDYLPPSQLARLDQKMGEVQFTDAISRTIESQEDFS